MSHHYAILVASAAVLFLLLSPGFLVTLPPTKGCKPFAQLWNKNATTPNCATSVMAVFLHTLVFVLIFAAIAYFTLKPKFGGGKSALESGWYDYY